MKKGSFPLYSLSFSRPSAHLVDVEMSVPVADPARPVELWMPVWTPGSYLIREYSRHVERFGARDDTGRDLPWRKTSKNSWEVDPGGASVIAVTYHVYGREMTVRNNWIEEGWALLNGACTFLTVRGLESGPHQVRVAIPRHWSGVWTALDGGPETATAGAAVEGNPARGGSARGGDSAGERVFSFAARDLDELVDSPILAGNPAVYEFAVDGVPVSLVNEGEGGLWDGTRAADDVKAVVEQYRAMYGSVPFPRYLFLNLITESRGGLEHKNCSVLMTTRYAYRRRKAYVSWLGLMSHEFFHAWNVKRSRPEALGPFDYENENYTRGLWVAEGFTNYYTDLMPRRAGLITDAEYLEALSGLLSGLQNTPGRLLSSLEESSFDTWIKLYRPDENTGNTTISYYVKGAVVAWLLDMEIRRATGGARSLDDMMRALFARFSGERGYRDAEVQAVAEETAGRPLQDFFDRYVRGRDELDYDAALERVGLRFKPAGGAEAANGEAPRNWLGIESRTENGRVIVKSVRRDGPAYEAGLDTDDEILAVGGYRVLRDNFAERLLQYPPGERLELLISRREAVRIVPITPAAHPGQPWRLEIDPEASPEAEAARQAWWGTTPHAPTA